MGTDCAGRRDHPKPSKDAKTGEMEFTYAGQCDGGIKSHNFRCGKINGPWPVGIVDMLDSLDGSVGSVLVKGYDYLLSPDSQELDTLGLRESMLFSPELRGLGDKFIASTLKGRPYLAAHCRRTDFLRARLQKRVKGDIHFYEEANGGKSLELPGHQAAVEMWIASRAEFFIGSIGSRFTMWIQLERGFLGKSKESSELEFCKDSKESKKKKCIAPKYRHPPRKGSHRVAYLS